MVSKLNLDIFNLLIVKVVNDSGKLVILLDVYRCKMRIFI